MGLERVFLVRGDTVSYCIVGFIGWLVLYCWLDFIISLARPYRIGWIVLLDRIASAGLDCIVSYRMDQETLAFANWLVTAWMGRMGKMDWTGRWWDGGRMDGSYQAPEQERHHGRHNRSATVGS